MKNVFAILGCVISSIMAGHAAIAQEVVSVRLTDVIKSQGVGNIDLFKDVNAAQLEQYRLANEGSLVFAVDINEDASGTEKASSQGVAVKYVSLSVEFDDGSSLAYTSEGDCCFSETQALLAEVPSTERQLYYTFLGESGSSRISSSNSIQDAFDSTLKVELSEQLYSESGRTAVSADLQIVLLQTNEALGDPEAFYDFSAGFEDLALLNAEDAAFIDDYGAGREEAPTVILTNPPPVIDPLAVANWNYFPSSTTFYVVGYEDLYPVRGDYDFNDLTVAYRVQFGQNADGDVVSIQGLAYLLTRGSAYSHDWRLRIPLIDGVSGSLSCTTYPDHRNPASSQACSASAPTGIADNIDVTLFEDTLAVFPDPAGSLFVNTQELYSAPWYLKYFNGPKTEFRVDFTAPVNPSDIASAPFDPYLYVRDTNRTVKLMEVDPYYQDSNGFPFGMLLTSAWKPPLEFTDTRTAYPLFEDFVLSEGASSAAWYDSPQNAHVVEIPASDQWAW